MITVLILVLAALGCGFCLGKARRHALAARKPSLPLVVVVRKEEDDQALAEFLARERRYLRLFGQQE